MNLWGGRFTKPTNQLVYDFNASIKFDKTFARVDFPAPFLPRIIRFSPSFKENVISFKISLL